MSDWHGAQSALASAGECLTRGDLSGAEAWLREAFARLNDDDRRGGGPGGGCSATVFDLEELYLRCKGTTRDFLVPQEFPSFLHHGHDLDDGLLPRFVVMPGVRPALGALAAPFQVEPRRHFVGGQVELVRM